MNIRPLDFAKRPYGTAVLLALLTGCGDASHAPKPDTGTGPDATSGEVAGPDAGVSPDVLPLEVRMGTDTQPTMSVEPDGGAGPDALAVDLAVGTDSPPTNPVAGDGGSGPDVLAQEAGPAVDTATQPTTEWTAAEVESLYEYLVGMNRLEPLGKDHDTVTKKEIVGSDSLKYTQEDHEVLKNITSVGFLGLNDDVIWPGNIIKGNRAHEFVYAPVSLDRTPLTISLSLEGSAMGNLSKTIAAPKLSTLRQGIADLLKGALVEGTSVPAKVDFRYQQVYSESQMNLFLNTSLSYSGLDVNAHFDWKSTTKKNKIFADYTQVYYSVDLDYPTNPLDMFARTQPASRIKAALPVGSNPLYVAGVSYGLRAMMFIETDYQEQEMKAALDAAYKGSFEVKLDSGYTAKDILSASSIRILVYGGSTAGLADMELDFEGFKKVVRASNQFSAGSPGVPLLYKFRNLSDNTLAQISLTSQYSVVTGQPRVRLALTKIVCDFADDEGTDNTVDINKLSVYAGMFNSAGQVIVEAKEFYGWDGPSWGADTGSTKDLTEMNSVDFYIDPATVANTYIQVGAYARDDDDNSALNRDDIAENANVLKLTPDLYTDHDEVFSISSADNFGLKFYLEVKRFN